MKRGVKIVATASTVVAVIVVASALSSMAIVPTFPDNSISGLMATPDSPDQDIHVQWHHLGTKNVSPTSYDGFDVKYSHSGGSTTNTFVTNNYYNHTDPAYDTEYTYYVRTSMVSSKDGSWSDALKATVYAPPTITAGTFNESTNIVTLTADRDIKTAKASNVCLHNTIQLSDGTYEPFSRCGTSATISTTTVTVTISGEYSVNATMTSESIGIGANAVESTQNLWNTESQEITLYGQ